MDAPDQVSRFKIWTEIKISFPYQSYNIKSEQLQMNN